jgi:SAM-dependent MidA family methyltransferase
MIETIPTASRLASRLREQIRKDGPLPFYDWMKAALYHPEDGYYCRSDFERWGREGDYRTSPERSAMFAATFARYFAALYENMGRPPQWTIMELGAGDGHFAGGVLATLQRSFPDCCAATSYVIDEVSAPARALARRRLRQFGDRVAFARLKETQLNPGVVFSNEFLDALPVHRVACLDGRLREFRVGVGANGDFEWLLSEPEPALSARCLEYFRTYGVQLSEGQIAEVCFEIEDWLALVAQQMETGYLVTVDYGATATDLYSSLERLGGTLRGFQRHEFVVDLLARPGEHDLTTTVNWSQVKSAGAACGITVVNFERQDRFLLAAGLLAQLECETNQCPSAAERLRTSIAAREMVLPDGMAAHFQVLVQQKQCKS